jgi:hypothetical protein
MAAHREISQYYATRVPWLGAAAQIAECEGFKAFSQMKEENDETTPVPFWQKLQERLTSKGGWNAEFYLHPTKRNGDQNSGPRFVRSTS